MVISCYFWLCLLMNHPWNSNLMICFVCFIPGHCPHVGRIPILPSRVYHALFLVFGVYDALIRSTLPWFPLGFPLLFPHFLGFFPNFSLDSLTGAPQPLRARWDSGPVARQRPRLRPEEPSVFPDGRISMVRLAVSPITWGFIYIYMYDMISWE